jgi:cytochrome c oxidase subunit 6b
MLTECSIGFDARFPNVNQTKHCWQNYVDYHKCINAKGEDFKPCKQVQHLSGSFEIYITNRMLQFKFAYHSLCHSGWTERWDEQRGKSSLLSLLPSILDTNQLAENGIFPSKLD